MAIGLLLQIKNSMNTVRKNILCNINITFEKACLNECQINKIFND